MFKFKRRYLFAIVLISLAILISGNVFLNHIYRFPVLMYHSIDYTSDSHNKIVVSPEIFSKQMKYLHDNKYNVVSLREAVSYIKDRKRPPKRTVTITIDDGYKNNYKYAYPVLKKYKIPATIFVITDLVGKRDFMDWNQIKEMSDSGIIDIESHTKTHKWLTSLSDNSLEEEFKGSRKILEEKLGKKVEYVCYPMGGYDERVKLSAKKSGYMAGFATKPTMLAPNYDIYEIKRVRISSSSNNIFVFALKLSGYHAFFRIIHNDYKDIPYLLWKKEKESL